MHQNKILAIASTYIPYVKETRAITGSVTASILWQNLEFLFSIQEGPFYKFLEPCEHPLYRKGDSWVESLAFSADEFRSAFSKIGVKYNSISSYEIALEMNSLFIGEDNTEKMYAAVYDKISKKTMFYRNDNLVNLNISKLIK